MIELLFRDGTVITGETFEEVEDALRAAQPYPYKNRRQFRADMRQRARTWSGRRQKPYPPWTSKAFILSLWGANMFSLLIRDEAELEPQNEE